MDVRTSAAPVSASVPLHTELVKSLLARRWERRSRRQPQLDLVVDRRVIEQIEVIGAADVAVVVDRELQPLTAASVRPRAGAQYQQVADDAPCRTVPARAHE